MWPTLISPTGRGFRGSDAWGSGSWLASRGNRLHLGIDFRASVGQSVVMPCTARVVRRKLPYKDDLSYDGVLLSTGQLELTMYYVKVEAPIGVLLPIGAHLGVAQNIAQRYDNRMTPHIHLEVAVKTLKSSSLQQRGLTEGKHYVVTHNGNIMLDPRILMKADA